MRWGFNIFKIQIHSFLPELCFDSPEKIFDYIEEILITRITIQFL